MPRGRQKRPNQSQILNQAPPQRQHIHISLGWHRASSKLDRMYLAAEVALEDAGVSRAAEAHAGRLGRLRGLGDDLRGRFEGGVNGPGRGGDDGCVSCGGIVGGAE